MPAPIPSARTRRSELVAQLRALNVLLSAPVPLGWRAELEALARERVTRTALRRRNAVAAAAIR